ncbi:MAG: hypothetical protein U5J63_16365 [Fodinibius sp.]|nr:hypothetical protein [Fodinibius sp.]
MYIGLQHLHSDLAYLVLLILVGVISYVLVNFINKKTLAEKARKFSLVGLIAALGLTNFFGKAMGNALSAAVYGRASTDHDYWNCGHYHRILAKAQSGDDAARYKKPSFFMTWDYY